jgi:hypothetical protein
MTTPRRRLVRPRPVTLAPSPDRQRRLEKLRSRLAGERSGLTRWMSRLRRAFHAVEKHQQRIARLERQLTPREE